MSQEKLEQYTRRIRKDFSDYIRTLPFDETFRHKCNNLLIAYDQMKAICDSRSFEKRRMFLCLKSFDNVYEKNKVYYLNENKDYIKAENECFVNRDNKDFIEIKTL